MVELVVSKIMTMTSDKRAHALILKERYGLRKIIMAVGALEAQAIAFAMRSVKPARPLTHELFEKLAKSFCIKLETMVIDRIEDGTFYSIMFFTQETGYACFEARASDAIAIALRWNVRILIRRELLERLCIRDEENGAISMPITVADEATLREAMEDAVKEENYELAMKLKEEIDSRHSGPFKKRNRKDYE